MSRLRIIAGPNGSGKTTLTKDLQNNYHLNFGYYINADEIERIFKTHKKFGFRRFGLTIKVAEFESFYFTHPLYERCGNITFRITRNTFYLETLLENFSYFSALFADFLRNQLMIGKQTFSFETVMSGSDKLEFMRKSREKGYRIYLYFICTDDALINRHRVADRVEKGGHAVPDAKIVKRYYGSLSNLLDAIKLSSRAYLFDNSGTMHRLVAEINDGTKINFDPQFVPQWFDKYVIRKLKPGG